MIWQSVFFLIRLKKLLFVCEIPTYNHDSTEPKLPSVFHIFARTHLLQSKHKQDEKQAHLSSFGLLSFEEIVDVNTY